MDPLVSVIIPVWDVQKLLPRCLDSALAQTHRPLEIIVVDDGSTDGSLAVMQAYARAHSEVQVISQRHRSLGPARNAALSVAQGEFVAFMDADDWVEPDFISDTVQIAQDMGADVVVGGFVFHVGRLRMPFPFLPRVSSMTGAEAAKLSIHMTRFPAFAWNKLYRRSLFLPDDPPFPTIEYEDLATTPRLLQRAGTVGLTRKVYYHYCLRSDSITGAFSAKNVFSFAAAIDLLRHDLHENDLWDGWNRSYRRLLRQALMIMGMQTMLQPNRIPLRQRGPLMVRFARRLRGLSERPTDGQRLRARRIRTTKARGSMPRQPVSATITVTQADPTESQA